MAWTDNALVAAATSAAATSAFCMTMVVPIWTKSIENNLATAQEDLEEERRKQKEIDEKLASIESVTKPLKDKIASLQSDLAANERKLVAANLELELLRTDKMFAEDDLYPAGFRSVRVGNPSKLIFSAYPEQKIERNRDIWITVELRGPVFDSATFHVRTCEATEVITRASFHLKTPKEWPLIAAKAEATFGENFWTLYENKFGDRELRSRVVKGVVAELDQLNKDQDEMQSASLAIISAKPLICGNLEISWEKMETVVGPRNPGGQ